MPIVKKKRIVFCHFLPVTVLHMREKTRGRC